MSFAQFYGLAPGQLMHSTSAEVPEALYRSLDIDTARAMLMQSAPAQSDYVMFRSGSSLPVNDARPAAVAMLEAGPRPTVCCYEVRSFRCSAARFECSDIGVTSQESTRLLMIRVFVRQQLAQSLFVRDLTP
jgi:hypothetical protein